MLKITPRAKADLQEIKRYWITNYPATLPKVENFLRDALKRIDGFATSGALLDTKSKIHRRLVTDDQRYTIYYRVDPNGEIRILTIRNARSPLLTSDDLK